MTIVNNQRGSSLADKALRNLRHDGLARRRNLEHRARRRLMTARQQLWIDLCQTRLKMQIATVVQGNHALAKSVRGLDKLADGQSIEQFIGHQQGKARGDIFKSLMPLGGDRAGRQGLPLHLLQPLAGLNHVRSG